MTENRRRSLSTILFSTILRLHPRLRHKIRINGLEQTYYNSYIFKY